MQSNKKPLTPWWVFALIAVLLVLFFITVFGGTAISRSKPSSVRVENPIDIEYSGCHIKAINYEITGGSDPRLYLYYKFENNNDNGTTYVFKDLIYQTAYQDNVQLESFNVNSDYGDDAYATIRPGASITVCTGFKLRNVYSDVEITMRTFNWIFNEDLAQMVFHLS